MAGVRMKKFFQQLVETMQTLPFQRRPSFWLIVVGLIILPSIPQAQAKSYFEDGYLGLTKPELHESLGTPHAIRSRKAALRVFSYYSAKDWNKYFRKLVSPENGEDVYTFTRENIQVRYAFVYTPDLRESKDFPTLYVKRVEVEFTPAVPIESIPNLVPEFAPPTLPHSPVFRSNLWVLIFKGPPSQDAMLLVKEYNKENWDWSLAYQLFSLKGIPEHVTRQSKIDRLEFTVQSLPLIKKTRRHTHEPYLNPYSVEFAQRPSEPPPKTKSIPVPVYAD
jgi:hypothetical protein